MSEMFDALLGVYLDLLSETLAEHRGYFLEPQTGLLDTLATIDAATASRPVGGHCATLAAQVAHLQLYIDVSVDNMLGKDTSATNWREIWETVGAVSEEEWAASQQSVQASYARLREVASNPASWASDAAFGEALAALAHSAYHLGNIRQSLCILH